MTDSTRRLPIYLLVDCSESMAGEAIEGVSRGIEEMVEALKSDPLAIETAWLSVIAFSSNANQLHPLTELLNFQPPKLSVRTGTALGSALRLTVQCIDRDVRRTTKEQKGDYKPMVILLTDGEPTDEWESAARGIQSRRQPGIANIYAIACGPDADVNMLREVTDIVLRMKDMSRETWRKLFVWLTASIQTTSRALEGAGEGQSVNLPALPEDALEMAAPTSEPKDPRPRQVFLHAYCTRSGKPYLMRFAREPYEDVYTPVRSHPLEPREVSEAEALPPIPSSLLNGTPPCPHCENAGAGACGCGAVICCSPTDETLVCPRCHQQIMIAPDGTPGGFDVQQSQG